MKRKIISLITIVFILATVCTNVFAADTVNRDLPIQSTGKQGKDLFSWEKNSATNGKGYEAMCYNGKDLYVALSQDHVKTSTDGVNWNTYKIDVNYNTRFDRSLSDLTYGNGIFVAVGSEGTILTSIDGVQWLRRESGLGSAQFIGDKNLFKVYWTGEKFIAIGADGLIITSQNGENWDKINTSGIDSTYTLMDIQYINGKYIMVGGRPWMAGAILSSTDAVNWQTEASVKGGEISTLSYNGSILVACGENGTILYSKDMVNWIKVSNKLRGNIIQVIWDGEQFFAVGYAFILREDNSDLYTYQSKDGVNWVEMNQIKVKDKNGNTKYSQLIRSMVYDGKYLLGIHDFYEIVQSSNVTNWSIIDKDNAIQFAATKISYVGDKYFASSGNHALNTLFISRNGTDWTNITDNLKSVVSNRDFAIGEVFWNGSQYILSGVIWNNGWERKTFYSNDGYTWRYRELTINNKSYNTEDLQINSIRYINNKFVAVGKMSSATSQSNSVILKSDDGFKWETVGESIPGCILYDVAWGNGNYIAIGGMFEPSKESPLIWNGTGLEVLVSKDLSNWTEVKTNINGASISEIIYWDGQQFIMPVQTDSNVDMYYSDNGQTWDIKELDYDSTYLPKSIVSGNGIRIGVGDYGHILVSTDGVNWTKMDFENRADSLYTVCWDGKKFISGGFNAIFTYTPEKVIKLFTSDNKIKLNVGDTKEVNIYGESESFIGRIPATYLKWGVSDPKTVLVSEGKIKALKPGNAKITCSYMNIQITIELNIVQTKVVKEEK